LQEIHRNERCEEMSSREWEQMHENGASQTGCSYVELEEVWMRKSYHTLTFKNNSQGDHWPTATSNVLWLPAQGCGSWS